MLPITINSSITKGEVVQNQYGALKTMSIKQIRQNGYKVYVKHLRYYEVEDYYNRLYIVGPFTKKEAEFCGYSSKNLVARGGLTEVQVYNGDEVITEGRTRCSPRDPFCRKIGRQIALGRALSKFSF